MNFLLHQATRNAREAVNKSIKLLLTEIPKILSRKLWKIEMYLRSAVYLKPRQLSFD
tara:strand:- start:466 stop:636 length:171 start_codon:yes stop_codon:yes gene_type:complete